MRDDVCHLKAANNIPLDVLGIVDLDVIICGVSIPVQFYVVRNLSQNCILGGSFFEECRATIDYGKKTLSLYENIITVPLLNDVELHKTLRTTTKLRIPPLSEVIFPARINKPPQCTVTGITEAIPSVRNRGLLVANVLQNTAKPILTCRMLNTTRKVVYLPANYAFGYLSSIDVTEGVNLIDVNMQETSRSCMNDVCNESSKTDDMPDHDTRLEYLRSCGIQIGTDVLNDDEFQELTALLYSYRDIFATDYKDVPAADIPPHEIVLTDNKIVNERRFRYNPAQERLLEERCDALLKAGMLKESSSVWNSPVFLINQKGDRSARFLVDFRSVNAKAEPLYCSLPSLEEVSDQIGDENPKIYSVLDLKMGYYSVPLHENSRKYTAFSTKNRHLEFTRLPQGYRNAPSAFSKALSDIFAQELRSTLLIYIADLICFHRDTKTHIKFLEQILAKFRKFKLRLHPSKLRFAMSSVKFLGYEIGQHGYTSDTSRTSVIKNYPQPKSQRDIKRFTGLCSYFRRTIRNYSKRAEPLRRLLIKDTPFVWTDEQQRAFCDLKNELCNPPTLGFPDRNKPMRLTLDSCSTGLGCILSNINDDGTETVLHYGARATTKSERAYSATDLELAALLTDIRTFNSYLANTHFEVLSDHISLTYIRNLKFGTSRLVRASIMLSQYDFSIRHLSSKENGASDAISRIPNLQADDLTLHEEQRCKNDDNDLLSPAFFENEGDDRRTESLNHCVMAVSQKKKRRNKRRKPVYFDDSVTDKNMDRTSQNDVSKTTITSTNDCRPTADQPTDQPCVEHDSTCVTIETQARDSDFHHVINYLLHGTLPADDKIARRTLLLSDYYVISDGKLFHLMTSRRKNNKMQDCLMKQLCIPKEMRTELLTKFHSQLMHIGGEKMYLTMRSKIYWPNLYNDVRDFVAHCEICYQIKPNTHAKKAKIQIREIPKTLFHTIHLDHLQLTVPNATHPFKYVLVIIDELSLQVELIPTKTTSASECANALFNNWICRYGVPSVLISDRHKAFTAGLTQELFRLCNIKHELISTKNPRSNGLCEQVNSRIINAIKIHCSTHGNWPNLLQAIAAAHRAAVTPTRQHSPFFVCYGCEMIMPTDLDCGTTLPAHERQDSNIAIFSDRMKILRGEIQQFAQNKREQTTAEINKTKTQTEYTIGQKVYLANETIKPDEYRKSSLRYTGPYLIINKSEHNTYKLTHIYTGKTLKSFIHFDKLKPTTEQRKSRKISKEESQEEDDSDTLKHHYSSAPEDGNEVHAAPRRDVIITDNAQQPCRSSSASRSKAVPTAPDRSHNDNAAAGECVVDCTTAPFSDSEVKEATPSANSELVTQISCRTSTNAKENNEQNTLHNDATTMFAVNDNYNEWCDGNRPTSAENIALLPLENHRPTENKRYLHKRCSEMKKILKISRTKGCSRCHVLLNNGERIVCNLVQIPTELLCKFRLNKHYQKQKNKPI